MGNRTSRSKNSKPDWERVSVCRPCVGLSSSCVCPLKKVLKAAEQLRPDVDQQRSSWRLLQAGLDPEKLVFLDEAWAKTNMTRPRGRALCGERLVCHAPFGHRKTTMFLAGLRQSGLTAPLVIDGAVNGAVLRPCGTPAANCSIASHPVNVPTTSDTADTAAHKRDSL